jgi:glycosyltransferase involved in cell wall biosynthesis
VHAHFSWTSGYVAARLKEDTGVPYVVTVHENEERLTEEIESENEDLYRAWEDANAIIRVNKKDCERLEAFNDDVYHVPHGYSRDRFPNLSKAEAREQLGIDEELDLIFSLGSLIPRKQFDVLVDAVGQLDDRDNLYCAIGGHGRLEEELRDQIKTQGLEDRIELLGYLSEEELAYWMNACDIFALASRAEGNPTVMFEALGCGRPYVGTEVGGVGEVITSGKYGLVCEPDSASSLSEVLERGLNIKWDTEAICSYAQRFPWERVADKLKEIHVYALNADPAGSKTAVR